MWAQAELLGQGPFPSLEVWNFYPNSSLPCSVFETLPFHRGPRGGRVALLALDCELDHVTCFDPGRMRWIGVINLLSSWAWSSPLCTSAISPGRTHPDVGPCRLGPRRSRASELSWTFCMEQSHTVKPSPSADPWMWEVVIVLLSHWVWGLAWWSSG